MNLNDLYGVPAPLLACVGYMESSQRTDDSISCLFGLLYHDSNLIEIKVKVRRMPDFCGGVMYLSPQIRYYDITWPQSINGKRLDNPSMLAAECANLENLLGVGGICGSVLDTYLEYVIAYNILYYAVKKGRRGLVAADRNGYICSRIFNSFKKIGIFYHNEFNEQNIYCKNLAVPFINKNSECAVSWLITRIYLEYDLDMTAPHSESGITCREIEKLEKGCNRPTVQFNKSEQNKLRQSLEIMGCDYVEGFSNA